MYNFLRFLSFCAVLNAALWYLVDIILLLAFFYIFHGFMLSYCGKAVLTKTFLHRIFLLCLLISLDLSNTLCIDFLHTSNKVYQSLRFTNNVHAILLTYPHLISILTFFHLILFNYNSYTVFIYPLSSFFSHFLQQPPFTQQVVPCVVWMVGPNLLCRVYQEHGENKKEV